MARRLDAARRPGGRLAWCSSRCPGVHRGRTHHAGARAAFGSLCDTLASEIHHTAFLELAHKGGEGPASQIVREMCTKRGATRVFGSYGPVHYIEEPGGWKALADKVATI